MDKHQKLSNPAMRKSYCGRYSPTIEPATREVRSNSEDHKATMGMTLPPRSYSCSFCHREFRSAQALGGHMNVHRRDRAKFHQGSEPSPTLSISYSSSNIATDEGLCFDDQVSITHVVFTQPVAGHFGKEALSLLDGMTAKEIGKVKSKCNCSYDEIGGMVVDEIDLELRLGR